MLKSQLNRKWLKKQAYEIVQSSCMCALARSLLNMTSINVKTAPGKQPCPDTVERSVVCVCACGGGGGLQCH